MEAFTGLYFFFLVLVLCLCVSGCGGDEDEVRKPVSFVSAVPPGGELPANGAITVTFDGPPRDVRVSAGIVTVSGNTATITGPFTPGALTVTITWADGSQSLNYHP